MTTRYLKPTISEFSMSVSPLKQCTNKSVQRSRAFSSYYYLDCIKHAFQTLIRLHCDVKIRIDKHLTRLGGNPWAFVHGNVFVEASRHQPPTLDL